MNLRTYVTYDDKPGVWFLRIDASNSVAAWSARELFLLPYVVSAVSTEENDNWKHFTATHKDDSAFRVRYRPGSVPHESTPGSTDHFLMERYCQYAVGRHGQLLRTDVHHQPWPLQDVELLVQQNTVFASLGLVALTASPAHAYFTRELDAVIWNPVPAKSRQKVERKRRARLSSSVHFRVA